jgi:purine-cytosine permease-like protein
MNHFGETIVVIIVLSVVVAFIGWCGCNIGTSGKPTAMDVYQGKTTLEIPYKDGVPIDSVVVFKDK